MASIFSQLYLNIKTCNLKKKNKDNESCNVGCTITEIECLLCFLKDRLLSPFWLLAENRMPKNCNRKKMGMINADIGNLSYIKMLKYIIKNITLSIIINFSVSCSVGCAWTQIGSSLFFSRDKDVRSLVPESKHNETN
jgi:hypothetical protein